MFKCLRVDPKLNMPTIRLLAYVLHEVTSAQLSVQHQPENLCRSSTRLESRHKPGGDRLTRRGAGIGGGWPDGPGDYEPQWHEEKLDAVDA